MKISVQTEDFDLSQEFKTLRENRTDIGAVASFVGLVRDMNDGAMVSSMTLEHYAGMVTYALENIVSQAKCRWNILDVVIIHRIGKLSLSDQIVLVMVASQHRQDAFLACEFIMDYLKTDAPFWKKETTSQGDRWVEAKAVDEEVHKRWS